jgi:hypothetical protein
VECRVVGCTGEALAETVRVLNTEEWHIRNIYQEVIAEPPAHIYRVLAQRLVSGKGEDEAA